MLYLEPEDKCSKHFLGRALGARREPGLYAKLCVGEKIFALPGSLTTAEAPKATRSRHNANNEAIVSVGAGALDSIGSHETPAPDPTRQRLSVSV